MKFLDWKATDLQKYLFVEDDNDCRRCFISMSPCFAVSYYHGSHAKKTTETTYYTIYQYGNPSNRHRVKVIHTNDNFDFILVMVVQPDMVGLTQPPINQLISGVLPTDTTLNNSAPYIVLGLSTRQSKNQEGKEVLLTPTGRIMCDQTTRKGHVIGSANTTIGDSGGPVFGAFNYLIGMTVGTTPLDNKHKAQYESPEKSANGESSQQNLKEAVDRKFSAYSKGIKTFSNQAWRADSSAASHFPHHHFLHVSRIIEAIEVMCYTLNIL